jgi:hypothetical protein
MRIVWWVLIAVGCHAEARPQDRPHACEAWARETASTIMAEVSSRLVGEVKDCLDAHPTSPTECMSADERVRFDASVREATARCVAWTEDEFACARARDRSPRCHDLLVAAGKSYDVTSQRDPAKPAHP